MKKTTKAQFNAFKRSFQKWQKHFGLGHWYVSFNHTRLEPGVLATFDIVEGSQQSAEVEFNSHLADDSHMDVKEAIVTGKHEATHMLLAQLGIYARERCFNEDAYYDEEERIVRLLDDFIPDRK
jgi:hypothetical protein